MSQEFIKELERQKAKQAEQGGFNTPTPAAPSFQPQAPQELSTPEFGPTLANEAQLPVLAPAVQTPAVQAETPLFQSTESGQRLASGVSSAKDSIFSAANSVSEAGGNLANSTSGVVADLINQSTGGRVNLQSPSASGVATKDNAGAPITDASQLRAFMSGLNEEAAASEPAATLAPEVPAASVAAPEVMATPESIADLSVNGTNVVTPEAITEAAPSAPRAQLPSTIQNTGGQGLTGFKPKYEGQSLTDFMAGRDDPSAASVQVQDPQGRFRRQAAPVAGETPEQNQARTDALFPEQAAFEQKSAAREARQAARPDFGEAQERAAGTVTDRERRAARGDGISDADRRDIAKANQQGASAGDIARGDKVAALNGVDRKTGKPPKKDGALTDYQKASLALRERELGNAGKKQTATEEKIATLKSANPSLSDADASAIASGSVKVVQNPLTGETQLLNIATGESRKVGADQDTSVNFDVAIPEKTLYGRIGKFTGAVEGTKRKFQALGGQIGVNVATDESLEASQDFKAAQNQLVRAFKQSDRYSATESKQLKEELGIDLSLFEDPKTAEAKLRSADQTLARNYENEIATFQDTSFPPEARQDARLRAKAIAEFRALIGVPEEGAKPVEVKFDPKSLTGENQQAYGWATSNPNDPRSQAILAKLNSQ